MAAQFPATTAGVVAALEALGSVPSKVAASLLAGGYSGLRIDCARCPIARYLLDVVDGACQVSAGPLLVQVAATVRIGGFVGVDVIQAVVPVAVRGFTAGFDAGDFPRLDLAVAA